MISIRVMLVTIAIGFLFTFTSSQDEWFLVDIPDYCTPRPIQLPSRYCTPYYVPISATSFLLIAILGWYTSIGCLCFLAWPIARPGMKPTRHLLAGTSFRIPLSKRCRAEEVCKGKYHDYQVEGSVFTVAISTFNAIIPPP